MKERGLKPEISTGSCPVEGMHSWDPSNPCRQGKTDVKTIMMMMMMILFVFYLTIYLMYFYLYCLTSLLYRCPFSSSLHIFSFQITHHPRSGRTTLASS